MSTDPLTADPLALTFPQPAWPFPTGFAKLSDVTARINASSWDPDSPTATVTEAQVNQWLMEATSRINSALAARGYWVPLRATPGCQQAPGTPLYQGIAVDAWNILRSICAAYATAMVEASRHGAVGTANEDPDRDWWLNQFTTFLKQIQDGTDNLTAFCVGGEFPPELSTSLDQLGFTVAGAVADHRSYFHKWSQNLGGGWEQGGTASVQSIVSGDRSPSPVISPEEGEFVSPPDEENQ